MENRSLRLLQIAFYLTGSLASGLVIWQAVKTAEPIFDPRPLQNIILNLQSLVSAHGLAGVLFLIAGVASLTGSVVSLIAIGRAIAKGSRRPIQGLADSRIFSIALPVMFLAAFAALLVKAIESAIRVVSTFR